jgi:hypothetical protein
VMAGVSSAFGAMPFGYCTLRICTRRFCQSPQTTSAATRVRVFSVMLLRENYSDPGCGFGV